MTTIKLGELTFTHTVNGGEARIMVKGCTPDGQKITYRCRLDKVISVCAQINPDGYGVIHVVFGYKDIDHPFQVQLAPGLDKKEIQRLVDWLSSMC